MSKQRNKKTPQNKGLPQKALKGNQAQSVPLNVTIVKEDSDAITWGWQNNQFIEQSLISSALSGVTILEEKVNAIIHAWEENEVTKQALVTQALGSVDN